jgi:hypothetical protein
LKDSPPPRQIGQRLAGFVPLTESGGITSPRGQGVPNSVYLGPGDATWARRRTEKGSPWGAVKMNSSERFTISYDCCAGEITLAKNEGEENQRIAFR